MEVPTPLGKGRRNRRPPLVGSLRCSRKRLESGLAEWPEDSATRSFNPLSNLLVENEKETPPEKVATLVFIGSVGTQLSAPLRNAESARPFIQWEESGGRNGSR